MRGSWLLSSPAALPAGDHVVATLGGTPPLLPAGRTACPRSSEAAAALPGFATAGTGLGLAAWLAGVLLRSHLSFLSTFFSFFFLISLGFQFPEPAVAAEAGSPGQDARPGVRGRGVHAGYSPAWVCREGRTVALGRTEPPLRSEPLTEREELVTR